MLCHKNGERCANCKRNDPKFDTIDSEAIEVGVVARPCRITRRPPGSAHAPDDIAIRVEHADHRYRSYIECFLTPGFAQQILRREH